MLVQNPFAVVLVSNILNMNQRFFVLSLLETSYLVNEKATMHCGNKIVPTALERHEPYKLYQNDWYWDIIEVTDFFKTNYEPI